LLVVAGLLLAGQTVIHQLLARQQGDARVINLAGRQRMLGQRLCLLTLALESDTGDAARATRGELLRVADEWERSQAALDAGRPDTGITGGNSPAVRGLFAQIAGDHRAMLAAARAAAALPDGEHRVAARTVRDHQDAFLAGMDRIVGEYEREASERIARLRRLEIVLLGLALLVFVLEGAFVFRPAVAGLRRYLAERDLVQRALDASEAEKHALAVRDGSERARLERQLLQIGDREQIRLAQDLHDGLGQHLIGVAYLLQPLRSEAAGSPAAARLDEVGRLVAEAIDHTRDLVRSLHSRALEVGGFTAALGELADHVARVFGVPCRIDDRADIELPLTRRIHLHRIAREAVVNAAKHAGATAIDIALARDGGDLVLTVRDDGIGMAAPRPDGMGIHLMAYRARLIGATLHITAGWRSGTTVTCRVPLCEPAPDAVPGPAAEDLR
jgi:signal transduction histidine kinase